MTRYSLGSFHQLGEISCIAVFQALQHPGFQILDHVWVSVIKFAQDRAQRRCGAFARSLERFGDVDEEELVGIVRI